jgi:phosphoribosylglycinamide formyltransferase-1
MGDRVAVLVSGTGTNLQALLDDPVVGPSIVLVVASTPDAAALGRARARGVPALVVDPGRFDTREAHDAALLAQLVAAGIGFVLLAGYLRILTAGVIERFEGRILNIHPSLLPAFPGAHAERDALEHGAKVTGVTVHLAGTELDGGPIVLQEAVPILPGDDERTLHARIQEVEHRLYPRAARLLLEGRLKVEGRKVHVVGSDEEDGS